MIEWNIKTWYDKTKQPKYANRGDAYEGIKKSLQKPMAVNPAANAAAGFGKD